MAYELLTSARRQGALEAQVRLTAPASTICVHAKIDAADKLEANSYRVECFISDDGKEWQFVGGGEHSTLGQVTKDGVTRERSDPRLRIQFSQLNRETKQEQPQYLPAGTYVRAVADVPKGMTIGLEIETEVDLAVKVR